MTSEQGQAKAEFPVMVSFSDATIVPAEGGRVGFVTCLKCGATLLLDAERDVLAIHREWHEGTR